MSLNNLFDKVSHSIEKLLDSSIEATINAHLTKKHLEIKSDKTLNPITNLSELKGAVTTYDSSVQALSSAILAVSGGSGPSKSVSVTDEHKRNAKITLAIIDFLNLTNFNDIEAKKQSDYYKALSDNVKTTSKLPSNVSSPKLLSNEKNYAAYYVINNIINDIVAQSYSVTIAVAVETRNILSTLKNSSDINKAYAQIFDTERIKMLLDSANTIINNDTVKQTDIDIINGAFKTINDAIDIDNASKNIDLKKYKLNTPDYNAAASLLNAINTIKTANSFKDMINAANKKAITSSGINKDNVSKIFSFNGNNKYKINSRNIFNNFKDYYTVYNLYSMFSNINKDKTEKLSIFSATDYINFKKYTDLYKMSNLTLISIIKYNTSSNLRCYNSILKLDALVNIVKLILDI